MTRPRLEICRALDAGDGITVIVRGRTTPEQDAAIRTLARGAARLMAAEQHPSLAGLARELSAANAGLRTRREIARTAGVRPSDVSCVMHQSARTSAWAANALAIWAGW